MNYPALSLIFLAVAALVFVAALVKEPSRRALIGRWWLPITIAGVAVMALTAIFDNVMIGLGLIAYDPHSNSGLSLGLAPLEDFAYPLAGLMILPTLWLLFRKQGTDVRH